MLLSEWLSFISAVSAEKSWHSDIGLKSLSPSRGGRSGSLAVDCSLVEDGVGGWTCPILKEMILIKAKERTWPRHFQTRSLR